MRSCWIVSRRIGPVGTACRVVVGLGLLVLAWYDAKSGLLFWVLVLGALVFPLVMVAVVLVARRFVDGPIRFMGSRGLTLNCLVLVVLFTVPYTRGAAALFYGVSLLAAAALALPGCEATVLPNALLGRDDQIGCPVFSPIDAAERSRAARP